MAAETISPPGPEADETELSQHRALNKASPKVGAAEFSARAEDIFRGINYLRDRGVTEREAYGKVAAAYIHEEEVPDLALFSDVLLAAPVIMHEQHHIQELRGRYQEGRDAGTREEYQDSVRTLVGYNHKLRDLIYRNPYGFTKNHLVEWLEKAAGTTGDKIESLVNGVVAEVAVKEELNAMTDVTTNRFATVEEDLQGTDLVAEFSNGVACAIDIKHGEYATMHGYDRRRDDAVILGLGPEDLQDFRLNRASREKVRRQLRSAAGVA